MLLDDGQISAQLTPQAAVAADTGRMQVSVAAAQVPVCWSVPRNLATIVEAIGSVAAGTLLILPEAALSGYDDQLSGLDDLVPGELAQARDAVGDAGPPGRTLGCHDRTPKATSSPRFAQAAA